MARTNAGPVRGVETSHSRESSVVVHEGLALSHKNNAGNARVKIVADVHNLLVNLARRKRARETSSACCTESTAHGAASLCRSTDRKLIASWHANALDRSAIWVAKQVFTTSILRDLTNNLFSTSKRYLLR